MNPTIERRMKILDLLDNNGQVNVTDLSKIFNISEVSIRNDLSQLEEKGLLIKTRGGALKTQRVGIDQHLNEKAKLFSREKQAIGKKAASLVNEADTIIIDSGTTTLEVAKNLGEIKKLTVITNSLNIASQLISFDMRVILLGGLLRSESLSLIGHIAENSIKNFYCDKVFIGVDGIDSQSGIYTPNPEEAHLNRLMIEISKEIIVVTDSSKFRRKSFAFIAPMNKVSAVVTDSNIPDEEFNNLQNMGVKVITV